jgi:hypothetical protein
VRIYHTVRGFGLWRLEKKKKIADTSFWVSGRARQFSSLPPGDLTPAFCCILDLYFVNMCFCTHSNITFTYYIRSQQWGFYVLFSAKILTCSMTMFLKFVCKNMCFCTHRNIYVWITFTYYIYAASHEDFMYFSVQKSLLAVWQCSWDMYVFCVLNQVKAFCLCIQIVTPEYVFHHVGSYDTLYRAYLQISHLCWLPLTHVCHPLMTGFQPWELFTSSVKRLSLSLDR